MRGFEEEWRAICDEYVREADVRLAELQRLIDRLERDGVDAWTLDQLLRKFHAFTGSGTTHGFPGVTRAGLEGEQLCGRVISGEGEADVSQLQELHARITAELQESAVRVLKN
jgi:hypothetical protein